MPEIATGWDQNRTPRELSTTPRGQVRTVQETEVGGTVEHGILAIVGGADAVAISGDATELRNVVLQARKANGSAVIYIGGAGVNGTNGGAELVAGAAIPSPSGDLAAVFAYSADNATLGWTGVS